MNKDIILYGFWFLLLPILQEVVFNQMYFFDIANPQFYVLYILIFPFMKDRFWLLWISFLMGLWVDSFTNEGGIHAFSLLFVAYIRVPLLNALRGSTLWDDGIFTYKSLPKRVFMGWMILLVLIHHTLVFVLEQFSWYMLGYTFYKIMLTSVLTVLFIMIFMELFMIKKKNEW